MYLTQIHNYVFNIDTPMLEMNSVSILGILIDNLSKKNKNRYRRFILSHLNPSYNVASSTTAIIQRLKSIYFLDYVYVLGCFDILDILINICEILYGWLMSNSL